MPSVRPILLRVILALLVASTFTACGPLTPEVPDNGPGPGYYEATPVETPPLEIAPEQPAPTDR